MRAQDQDLTILARTDAIAVKGLSRRVERAHRCVEAGADWVFLEAPENVEQMSADPGPGIRADAGQHDSRRQDPDPARR